MSEEINKAFWDRADAFIALANDFCEEEATGKVSSSLLYAAARFNTFVVASNSRSLEALEKDKKEALDYFTGQYRKMLEENLDDYIKSFDKYTNENS